MLYVLEKASNTTADKTPLLSIVEPATFEAMVPSGSRAEDILSAEGTQPTSVEGRTASIVTKKSSDSRRQKLRRAARVTVPPRLT